jgi:alkylation response protein AidB-like acyl-CoA dehydrogenase
MNNQTAEAPVRDTLDIPETAADILARARAVAPQLRARSEEIEQNRRLPADVVELLRGTGVFRMGFSRRWGGPELSSVQQTEVVEALAYGDASAGWCAMIGMDTGLYASFLDEVDVKEMFPSLDMITAGLLFPVGRAEIVPGGYRLTGRWQFGSGITHSDWVVSGAMLYRDGAPYPSKDGHDSRLFLVPRAQVDVIDTWHTTGLAGSGSCDYAITDVFVPEGHSIVFSAVRSGSGPLAQPEVHMRNMPGVALGISRAALDYAREVIAARRGWSESWRMQVGLAECEADFYAARAGVYAALRRQWEVLSDGDAASLTLDERAALPLSRLHAFRTARSIATRLYDLMQTASIYRPSPLDRWLRDTTTMCQHIVAQDRILQTAGAHLLGARPEFPLSLGITG